MLNLIRAEWKKATKNYMLIGFLVWSYPIGVGMLYGFFVLTALLVPRMRDGLTTMSSGQWTSDMAGIWGMVSTFPGNVFGRMLPLAFMAVIFAGEYQWGTWKNLIPRGRRISLLLAKFITLIAIIATSLLVTTLIAGVMQVIAHKIADLPYGPALSAEALADFARMYIREALLSVASLIILAGYASLAALLTRSILGSLMLGLGFSIVEPITITFFGLLGKLLDNNQAVNLYRFVPTYNIDNIRAWLVTDEALTGMPFGFNAEASLGFSAAMLALWIVGLVLLSAVIFQRQDITS